jgi:hypothetical protein
MTRKKKDPRVGTGKAEQAAIAKRGKEAIRRKRKEKK